METPDLRAVHAGTRGVYERHGSQWSALRNGSLRRERPWLERLVERLPAGARVLDLGCGNGRPVSHWLIEQGFAVTGIDYAASMIASAKTRFPLGDWREGDIRALDDTLEPDETFDAVLSWDGWFHLSPDEQRAALPGLCSRLRTGGHLMLTVGPDAGETTGHISDDPVYHGSLSTAEYETLMTASGLTDFSHQPDGSEPPGRHIILAAK